MKDKKSLIIILGLFIFVIFLAISFDMAGWGSSKPRPEPGYKVSLKYSVRDLPENYTAEQAVKDGCYVVVDSQVVVGEHLWKDFVKDASYEKEAAIRIISFGDDVISYQDLFYTDGYYHIFTPGSDDLDDIQEHIYKYLLILEGTMPNAAKSGKVTILTDDKTLTYDDIMWQILSSNPKPISSYERVFVDW